MKSLHVTIVGGTGFVGRHVADRLLRAMHRPTLVARHVPEDGAEPRPGLRYLRGDVLQPGSLDRSMQSADAVINLVGAVSQPSTQAYFDLHEQGARRVAVAAAAAGAGRLIHICALGISEDAPSAADRSKAAGERAVRAAFAQAVILRPSLLFAQDDHFLRQIASISRRSPVIPLIGAATRFQPAHVDDLAEGALRILEDYGNTAPLYQIAGPRIYTLEALVRELLQALGRRRLLLPLPNAVALPLGRLLGMLRNPPFTREQVALMMTDKVADPALPGLADLEVSPRLLSDWLAAPEVRYDGGAT
jgi:NADH dehydrogenase